MHLFLHTYLVFGYVVIYHCVSVYLTERMHAACVLILAHMCHILK